MSTEVLARNTVKTRYDDLSEEVRLATKRSILDTLGVMLPPTTLEKTCTVLYELVKEAGGKGEHGRRLWRESLPLDGCLS